MNGAMKNDKNSDNRKQFIDVMTRSVTLRSQGRHEEALECLDQALKTDGCFSPLLIEKAIVLGGAGRYEESIEIFDRVLRDFPNNAGVRRLRSDVIHEALAGYDRTLTAEPGNVEVLIKRGDVLQGSHRYEDAVRSYDLVLKIDPVNTGALNRRGNALLELNRHEDALESYERALETAPHSACLLFNRGRVFQLLGRFEDALEAFAGALACQPDLAEAAVEQSHCWLAMGDFKRGWPLYESRWRTNQLEGNRPASPQPLWLGGSEHIRGKRILLWAEQGLGDSIQFLRYVPLAAKIAGAVILRVPSALRRLSATLKSPISVVTLEEALPDHDFHCPLMSLPLALGTTSETIPADIPYLNALEGEVKKWRNAFGPCSKPGVGIVWAGRRLEPRNRSRDMKLEFLRPLAGLDINLVSLQKEIPEEDGEALELMPRISTPGDALMDFADTAALIETLSLVISVDTAVAHLAGALGKPVWLLLRHSGEWRWLVERSDSPWYPTMRIFRQKSRGDWIGVVREVVHELRILLKSNVLAGGNH